jgi:GT2 family glycosyltransferase
MPLVSVVIVTYNSKDFIDRCLEPLTKSASDEIEVIVVDNVSTDGTPDHVALTYPHVDLIRSKVNGGFAAGNNLGFRHCTAPFVLMLNPDAFVEGSEQIRNMVRSLQARPDVAAVGPRLINADGSHQVGDAGWRWGLGTVAAHMFFLQRIWPSLPALYLTAPQLLKRDEVTVDWVCGACTLVRKEVIVRIGGLDENIFMYGEDAEWGSRMREYGYRVLYLPRFIVMHLQGATQKGEEETFYSTKWIDSCADAFRLEPSRAVFLMFKAIMVTGFLMRSVLYSVDGWLRRRDLSKTRSRNMWNYMVHTLGMGWAGPRSP